MKKATKKLLTFALATLFVGAGIGSVATFKGLDANVAQAEESAKTTVDFASAITVHGNWGSGDYSENMAHIRLNAQGLAADWMEAGASMNNAHLPATVLDNVWVNGKSISQHNAEYKALIESGAESPITWDSSLGFNGEIADDVNNGRAIYSPIYIKLVNHGSGLAGSTIDIYSPNSYLSADEITELRITKDFLYETDSYSFSVSDDVIFKSNSLCLPDKYIGEANVPVLNLKTIETSIVKMIGTNNSSTGGWDSFMRFQLSESDYPTDKHTQAFSGGAAFLKQINLYDYILFDGVKLGTLCKRHQGTEFFFNVWGKSPTTWSMRWPNTLNNEASAYAVQEIKILAGCQFPSYTDPTGTVYEVKEDITLVATENGVFANEAYYLSDEDLTISEVRDAGEESELYAFDITFDKWNSTCDIYDYNYFGIEYKTMRQNILINGVSLWDINVNTDDSAYVYSTSPWTNDALEPQGSGYQLFQNPTLITGAGNKLTVYVHKDYVTSLNANTIEVTLKQGFSNNATPEYVAGEDIKATVWAKPVTVTVRLGGNPMDTSNVYTVDAKYGDTITLETPTADGKVFAGWVDINGNEITDWTVTGDTAIYANWTITPYTLTIKEDGQEDKTFTFGVETTMTGIDLTNADLAYVLEDNLPDDTADWDYEWAEEVPETFELKDYTFTVTKTEITTVDFTIQGEETTIEIPAGKTAQTYPRMAGDYMFSWTGDATIKVDGQEVTNGNIVTLWGSFVEIIPTDSSAACTVVLTLTEYVEPVPEMVLGDNAYTIKIENYYAGEVVAQYTATEAGKYVLSAAEGEENAFVLIEGDYGAEMIDLPYEFELAAGESMKFIISTGANVLTTTEDEINLVLAKAPEYSVVTIPEALAAEDGALVEVSGTVSNVNTAWSDQYGNITVTIVDAEGNSLYVYRLATKVTLGDIVTIKGEMATYNSNRQIAAGATAVVTGHDSSYDYTEMTIVEAIAADDGVNVIVTGTVVEIETAYSEQYKNISVYIADENGVRLYLYRLSGNVEVGQIIKVKGAMATYSEARQVTGGTYEEVGTHECSKYTEATCQAAAACVVCGEAKDDVLGEHDYVDGICTVCGDEEETQSSTTPDSSSTAPDSSSTTDSGSDDSSASAGCFGSISGIAGGMMALGAFAGVMLKKKKEEENK